MAGSSNVLQVVINGINGTGPAFRSVAIGAAAMATAVAGSFAYATHKAGQFERGVAEIGTLLDGDVRPQIASMRTELMNLSVQFGQSIGAMTKARYDIVSAGFSNAADSAMVLRESARLAVAGVSTVSETADLLTTAINGLGLSAGDASRVADVMFQTVRKGKTTISQLASAFGPVFATARVAKIELEELGAVMAVLTVKGVATAEAATALNALMRALAAPTSEAAAALDTMGISLDRGIMPALRALAVVGDEGLRALAEFIPNIEALKAASVAATDIGALASSMEAMGEATGQVNRGVKMMADTLPFKLDQLRAVAENIAITFGTMMIPYAKKGAEILTVVAFVVRFLAEDTDRAKEVWKTFVSELRDSSPVFDMISTAIDGVKSALKAAEEGFKNYGKNSRIMEEMQRIRDAGNAPMRPGIFGAIGLVDNAKLWDMAEALVTARDALDPKGSTKNVIEKLIEDTKAAFPELSAMLAQLRGEMDSLINAGDTVATPSNFKIVSGFGDQKPGFIGPPEPKKKKSGKKKKEPKDEFAELQKQVADLAKFTAEDFAQMAFSVGDSFGTIAGDVTTTLLGLREGPLMLGRAFKSMAAGILSDIARVIARLLVAKALLSIFGGGGFFGSVFKGLTGKDGATVPTASDGYTVPGSSMGGLFPPIILPGSPGLDRTPVLASGGEMLIPRARVNAAERMLRKPLTSPRGPGMGGGGRQRVEVKIQANRPFRTNEQIRLRDSVVEGLSRGERYSR